MKIELSPTEAAILLDSIQSMQSVKPEAPKVSSWEPKAGETVLVSDDGETWHRRIFKRLNENGEAIAEGPRDRAYSWEFMMPFDKNSIR
jgi:hypothetical protein